MAKGQPKGLARGLTNYGDPAFSLYLRRSFAKSMGYSSDMLGRPVVGIADSKSGFNNCHRHFPELIEAVKRGVLAGGALPIEFPTGVVVQDLWDKWLSYDPVVSWRHRTEQLRRLRGIRLDVGYHDEFDLQYGHRILSRGMAADGIAHEAVEHDGTHGSRLFERIQLSMEWFSRTLRLEE